MRPLTRWPGSWLLTVVARLTNRNWYLIWQERPDRSIDWGIWFCRVDR